MASHLPCHIPQISQGVFCGGGPQVQAVIGMACIHFLISAVGQQMVGFVCKLVKGVETRRLQKITDNLNKA